VWTLVGVVVLALQTLILPIPANASITLCSKTASVYFTSLANHGEAGAYFSLSSGQSVYAGSYVRDGSDGSAIDAPAVFINYGSGSFFAGGVNVTGSSGKLDGFVHILYDC
jgi:hypothetical protein